MNRSSFALGLALALNAVAAVAAAPPSQPLSRFNAGLAVAYGRYLPFGGLNPVTAIEMDARLHIGRLYTDSTLRGGLGHIHNNSAFDYLRAYSLSQRIGWIIRPRENFWIVPFARGALDLDSAGGLQTGVPATGLVKTVLGSNPNRIKRGYELGGGVEFQVALGSRLVLAPFFDVNYLHRVADVIEANGNVTQTYGDFTAFHYGAAADLRLIGPLDLYADIRSDRISGHGSALAYAGGLALRF